ncbi:hypothetical protein CHS0354_037625 [Potamilus streckersoni]|uniref:Uncharacterized protein n=1 Tax=Potamilus streckersoni TaxID=2493646 RepID=A0AAE0RUY3_9BIVA|nr:hypothetical protein CHS0354_037625 [Potamilus streckersoni]
MLHFHSLRCIQVGYNANGRYNNILKMEWQKKTAVAWNIPEKIADSNPRTFDINIEAESYMYSDTFEELTKSTQWLPYSDTFISESETQGSEIIETAIEATDNLLFSAIKTVYDISELQPHSKLETTAKSLEKLSPSSAKSSDGSQSRTQYSYSETFDSSDSLPPEKQFNKEGDTDISSYSETFEVESLTHTNSPQRSGYSSDVSQYSSDRGLQYDESLEYTRTKSTGSYTYISDERDDASENVGVEYSYTFEPTEEISKLQVVDLEALQKEEALKAESEAVREVFKSHAKMIIQQNPNRRSILDQKTIQKERHPKGKQNMYLKNYCKKKIKFLRNKVLNEIIQPGDTSKEMLKMEVSTLITDYGLDPAIIERLKLKKIIMCMKNANKIDVHDPGTCKECRAQKEIVDQKEAKKLFVDSRTQQLQTQVMDEKVEQHFLKMNSVSMIADLATMLPKLTDDPQIIQDKLYVTLYGQKYMR